jgi:hypothetical protein
MPGIKPINGKHSLRSSQNPLFRKVIRPWYDSETACYLVILLMLLVIAFSLAGIDVTREHPQYQRHVWVPVVLLILSLGVILSTIIRLIRRYSGRFPK